MLILKSFGITDHLSNKLSGVLLEIVLECVACRWIHKAAGHLDMTLKSSEYHKRANTARTRIRYIVPSFVPSVIIIISPLMHSLFFKSNFRM